MEQKEYFAQVDLAYGTLKGGELENRLLELTENSRKEYSAESTLYASMLSEMGGYYRGQGRFEESVRCFKEACDLLKAALGAKDPDYATAVNNLAGTYRLMGRLEEAEACFRQCLDCYRESLGETHILYASGLNNLSLVYLQRGDLAQAAELLGQASDILERYPDYLEDLATSFCNLAVLYQRLGRLDEAGERLDRAIEFYEGKLGTNTPHYHAALNSRGVVCYASGEYARAAEWFERAAQAACNLYGTEHREYQDAMKHLHMAQKAMEEQQ